MLVVTCTPNTMKYWHKALEHLMHVSEDPSANAVMLEAKQRNASPPSLSFKAAMMGFKRTGNS